MTLAIVGSIETERGAMGAVGARRRRIDRSEYDAACSARLAPRVRSGPGGGHTRPARPLRVHPVTAARAALVHFEVAHGVTAEDWQSVFRDATGRLQQTERYRHIAALYALVRDGRAGSTGAAWPEPVQPLRQPVTTAQVAGPSWPASRPQSSRAIASLTSS